MKIFLLVVVLISNIELDIMYNYRCTSDCQVKCHTRVREMTGMR